jgi:hypothetical protein
MTRAWLILENAAPLFMAVVMLLRARYDERGTTRPTRSEIAGAIVAAYCVRHAEDLINEIAEQGRRKIVLDALLRHEVCNQFSRSHRSRGIRRRQVATPPPTKPGAG